MLGCLHTNMLFINWGEGIAIFSGGSIKKTFEWIAGYAAVGENAYMAAVKSMIQEMFYK